MSSALGPHADACNCVRLLVVGFGAGIDFGCGEDRGEFSSELTTCLVTASRKRAYGSGSVFVRSGAFYGKWWVNGRQVKRKLGPCRQPGTRTGLTRSQAEARLRELMAETRVPASAERLTFEEVGRRQIRHLDEV